MNLAGMTLKEIGEKLGVNSATVCRDLEWVRHQWTKSAVENFEQARAIELARLKMVERKYWEAWKRSTEDKVTRIESYGTPNGQCGATLGVANHDAERRATLDHDAERRATYRWEKRETQSGKPSFLGVQSAHSVPLRGFCIVFALEEWVSYGDRQGTVSQEITVDGVPDTAELG